MADKKLPTISATSAERAPFVVFDGVSVFGQFQGQIQIELAAHVLVAAGDNVRIDVVQAGHLRCTLPAALQLKDAIEKIIAAMGRKELDEPLPALAFRH